MTDTPRRLDGGPNRAPDLAAGASFRRPQTFHAWS